MKENRYTLPTEERTNMVSEPLVGYSQLTDLRNQLVERVMNIQNPQTLQSLIVYVDKKYCCPIKLENSDSPLAHACA